MAGCSDDNTVSPLMVGAGDAAGANLSTLAYQRLIQSGGVLPTPRYNIGIAAVGDQLRQINGQYSQGCSLNTGIAFDGTNLIMSCWYNNRLDILSTADGSLVGTVIVPGYTGFGALAWDASRGMLWACGINGSGSSNVVLVNMATGVGVTQFQGAYVNGYTGACIDGLAYDGSDDTLWMSADVATTLYHYSPTGTVLGTHNVGASLGGNGSSGIATGGDNLYLANNGGSTIYEVPKNFSGSTFFASFPRRLEDLECDDITFASSGVAAMWSQDAYDRIINAFEIPQGSCTFGGGVVDAVPPFCALSATGTNASGKKYIQVTTRDDDSGLASIQVTKGTNLTVAIPAFTPGTNADVVVTATKVDQTKSSQLALRVTDVEGNVTNCDPVDVTVPRTTGKPVTHTFTEIPEAERWVEVHNGDAGLTSLAVTVNGSNFQVAGLKAGEQRTLDVGTAMQAGDNNVFELRATGKPGGSAWVLIRD